MPMTTGEHKMCIFHRDNADVELSIKAMTDLTRKLDIDPQIMGEASMGIMKRDLPYTDAEATTSSGRKKILVNVLNTCVRLDAERAKFRIHILAWYRCFCFHAAQLNMGDELDLINLSMPEGKAISQ